MAPKKMGGGHGDERKGVRNIPSLDGMRAISIALVILAHSTIHFPGLLKTIPLRSFLWMAHTGVLMFFVISGYLITTLLLAELDRTGGISLKRFYLRRAFRIFPPFYLYLICIFLFVLAGYFQTPLRAFLFAATYTLNYYTGPGNGFIGLQHIWSLCVEEQFYLLWPAALVFLGKRKAAYLAVVLILISPLSRYATYLVLDPKHRSMVEGMLHSSIDTIMFGCLMALLWHSGRLVSWRRFWANSWLLSGAVIFLFVLDPMLDSRFHGSYGLLIGMTLEGACICLITLYVVNLPLTLPGRFLNLPVLRHIGLISYSLYLWQNILTAETSPNYSLNLALILVCAELSYWTVEQPALRLRDRLTKSPSRTVAKVTTSHAKT
jgi:peptidoglycan/LPS O-acetylase OafA/YrhL